MPKIAYSSLVLVKWCTKEILCAHRLLKIIGNIGPILSYYIQPTQRTIDVHGLLHHCYTNDTQDYFFISEWMASNRLKLSPSKSEFLWYTTIRRRRLLDYSTFALGITEVRPAETTATLESNLTAVSLLRFM